jgi:hypothetical protein
MKQSLLAASAIKPKTRPANNELWVAAKPDNDTNNEENMFDNDSESNISFALDENDVGNILCREELGNVIDSVWGLDD